MNDNRVARVQEILRHAWDDLPATHRALLESIGAAGYAAVDGGLGSATNGMLISAGETQLSTESREDLDAAEGVWIPRLRIVLVNAVHRSLDGLDDSSLEAIVAYIAWHEWGHALSIERATRDDVRAGQRLLDKSPLAIATRIRASGYGLGDVTHEVIADVYALLMTRRRHGGEGKPDWLDEEIYELLERIVEWTN